MPDFKKNTNKLKNGSGENSLSKDFHQNDHHSASVGKTIFFDKPSGKALLIFDATNESEIKAFNDQINEASPPNIVEIEGNTLRRIMGQLKLDVRAKTDRMFKRDFQVIMALRINLETINSEESDRFRELLQNFKQKTSVMVSGYRGTVRRISSEYLLVSFNSAKDGLKCAIRIQREFNSCRSKIKPCKVTLNIGMCLGKLSKGNQESFEAKIKQARRISYIAVNRIFVSQSVMKQHQNETLQKIDSDKIAVLNKPDQVFIGKLLDCMEKNWQDEKFMVKDLEEYLHYSKSKLYRKMIDLLGEAPNNFIKEYRLFRSVELMRQKRGNISEVAFNSGFSSPSYFTKCFQKRFGLKPSQYRHSMFA